jgi:ectoine hydroxylase-related dioxygenase (phytanoyl-CoA dioxygenase family)
MLADQLKVLVHAQGFAVIPVCLEQAVVESLRAQFNESHPPERNILSIPSIQALATSKSVREIMEAILGPTCFAVRAIFFNKTQASNWKVVWHQDLTISVRDRKTVDGFGPWTTKEGVLHVQPSTEVMQGVLAIRLHLDESTNDNGPLRVIPGSHRKGRLSPKQISSFDKREAQTCTVQKGGALVMRPLLLHASSACEVPQSRRVVHIEFATAELPHCLEWHEEV